MLTDHQNKYQDIYKYELSVYLFHQVSDLHSLLRELKKYKWHILSKLSVVY